MNRFAYTILILLCSSIAIPSWSIENQSIITKASIKNSKKKFSEFLTKKNEEYKQLQKWTDPNSFFGPIISSAIETFSPWTRYGQIEPEKTKAFLGRAFSKPATLENAIDTLAHSEPNIDYLNQVLGEMSNKDIQQKNLGRLAKAMQGKPHPGISNTENLDTKNEDGRYIISDDNFYPFAVTNLFAVFCVEENMLVTHRKSKHPHSTTK